MSSPRSVPREKGKIFAFFGDGSGVGLKCGTRDEADEPSPASPTT